jgi:cytochrome c5
MMAKMRHEFGWACFTWAGAGHPEIIEKKAAMPCYGEKNMSDEKLRPEIATLLRQGAKPPKGPGLKLSQEEYEALIEKLRSLRDQVLEDNERIIRILGGK